MTTNLFQNKKQIFNYNDPDNDLFQVILPEFIISKKQFGEEIKIEIKEELLSIRNNEGKKEFNDAVEEIKKDNQKIIEEKLKNFRNDNNCLSYRFVEPEYYFRYANGGALPILRLKLDQSHEREDYFCFFYREIFPIGWNIANGASDNRRELFNPSDVIAREFNEELVITDNKKKLRYVFDIDNKSYTQQSHNVALKAWENKIEGISAYERLFLPVKWVDGPDSAVVTSGSRKKATHGCFLSITPEDNAIELDKIGFLNLSGDISLLDGEISNDGRLINMVIGLFKVDTFEKKLEGKHFLPDKIFFSGENRRVIDLKEIITDELLPQLGDIIDEKERNYYENCTHKFNLCPITRSIIKKYFEWNKNQNLYATAQRNQEKNKIERNVFENKDTDYQVFLSYKSEDNPYATKLYDYLTSLGEKVFFSGSSLQHLGESDYARAIDKALDKAECMIVVGTDPSYFDSGWVSYEWKSFSNEIRSERKKNGRLFTFTHNIKIKDMPLSLRSAQNVEFTPESIMDSFEMLMNFLQQRKGTQ